MNKNALKMLSQHWEEPEMNFLWFPNIGKVPKMIFYTVPMLGKGKKCIFMQSQRWER